LYAYEAQYFDAKTGTPRTDLSIPSNQSGMRKAAKIISHPSNKRARVKDKDKDKDKDKEKEKDKDKEKEDEDSVVDDPEELPKSRTLDLPDMPMKLEDDLVVHCLGVVVPKPPYISHKSIWPIGFKSTRHFPSMKDPTTRIEYTNEIRDIGDRPSFVVIPSDDEDNPIISTSPDHCWKAVIKHIEENSLEQTSLSGSGVSLFGLDNSVVSGLVHKMLNCSQENLISPPKKRRYNKRRRKQNPKFFNDTTDTSTKRARTSRSQSGTNNSASGQKTNGKKTTEDKAVLEANAVAVLEDLRKDAEDVSPFAVTNGNLDTTNLTSSNHSFVNSIPNPADSLGFNLPTAPNKDKHPHFFDFLFLYNLFTNKYTTNI